MQGYLLCASSSTSALVPQRRWVELHEKGALMVFDDRGGAPKSIVCVTYCTLQPLAAPPAAAVVAVEDVDVDVDVDDDYGGSGDLSDVDSVDDDDGGVDSDDDDDEDEGSAAGGSVGSAVRRSAWFELIDAVGRQRMAFGAASVAEAGEWVALLLNQIRCVAVDAVYENQRRWSAQGAFAPELLLPGDERGAWSDSEGRPLRGDGPRGAVLPAGWEWDDANWRIDSRDNHRTDSDGWEFASEWGSTWRGRSSGFSMVRRRIWVRTRRRVGVIGSDDAQEAARQLESSGPSAAPGTGAARVQRTQRDLFEKARELATRHGHDMAIILFDDCGQLTSWACTESGGDSVDDVIQHYRITVGSEVDELPVCSWCDSCKAYARRRQHLVQLLSAPQGLAAEREGAMTARQRSSSAQFDAVKAFVTEPFHPSGLESGDIRQGTFAEASAGGAWRLVQPIVGKYLSLDRAQSMSQFRQVLDAAIGGEPREEGGVWEQYGEVISALRREDHSDRALVLNLARGLAWQLEHLDGDVDLESALSEFQRVSPMLYDWSDEDLGEAQIIAHQPVQSVAVDGPRLTNTYVNGRRMPLFGEIEEEFDRQTMWLRSALSMIHGALLDAVDAVSSDASLDLPRSSLLGFRELSSALVQTKTDLILSSEPTEEHPRLLRDVDVYVLKCISQYGDNLVFGKFKELYPDTAEVVAQIDKQGRERRITVKPRDEPLPRSQRTGFATDFLDIVVERTFTVNLGLLEEDMRRLATVQLRLTQHVDAQGSRFVSTGLLLVFPPDVGDGAGEAARGAVDQFYKGRTPLRKR